MKLKWFDFLFIGILICAGLFVWISHINWVDERTYDPVYKHTWDEYAPDDGTDKGLLVVPVDLKDVKYTPYSDPRFKVNTKNTGEIKKINQ